MVESAELRSRGLERRIVGYSLRRVLCSARGAIAYDALDVERGAEVTLITVPMPPQAVLPSFDWLREGHFGCFPAIDELVRDGSEARLVVAFQGESLARVLERDGPFAPGAAARLLLQLLRDFEHAGDAHPLYRALGAGAEWLLLARDEHGDWRCRVLPVGLLEFSRAEHLAGPEAEEQAALSEMELLGVLLGWLVGQANIVASPELASVLDRLLDARPEHRFRDRRELMAALAPLTRRLSGTAPRLTTPRFDEEVQVTVFRPKSIVIGRWYRLLSFVHLAERRPGEDALDPLAEVRRMAQAALGEQSAAYRSATEDALAGLPEGGQVNLVPEVDGVEFNPPSRSFAWHSDVHDESFQLRAKSGHVGSTLRGRLSAYLGTVLLAEVGMAFKIQSSESTDTGPFAAERGKAYRKIFASYSHADARIVSDFEAVVSAFGDRYLIDVQDLRAGEAWSDALARLIDQADVFQLFWSQRSMSSEFCRREWEYALEKGVSIRPVYWERPMPAPPKALKGLHFAAFGGACAAEPQGREQSALDANTKVLHPARNWFAPVVAIAALVLWVGLQRGPFAETASKPHVVSQQPPATAEVGPGPTAEVDQSKPPSAPPVVALNPSATVRPSAGGTHAVHRDPGSRLEPSGSAVRPVAPPGGTAARTCFVEGVSSAPLYPQLSKPLLRESPCVGRNLASYPASKLPPRQARNAADRGCAWVVLRECTSRAPRYSD